MRKKERQREREWTPLVYSGIATFYDGGVWFRIDYSVAVVYEFGERSCRFESSRHGNSSRTERGKGRQIYFQIVSRCDVVHHSLTALKRTTRYVRLSCFLPLSLSLSLFLFIKIHSFNVY